MNLGSLQVKRAQTLVWLAAAIPLFISIAGLAIDGGVLLNSRRQLQSSVDGAARAAATRLDMSRLRASGGADVQLDPALANRTARTYLDQAFAAELHAWQSVPQTDVEVGPRRVHVQVRAELHTAFLQIAHIDTVPVEASAFADVQFGIHEGSGG
jgi:Flp pilus assembly protein TadG